MNEQHYSNYLALVLFAPRQEDSYQSHLDLIHAINQSAFNNDLFSIGISYLEQNYLSFTLEALQDVTADEMHENFMNLQSIFKQFNAKAVCYRQEHVTNDISFFGEVMFEAFEDICYEDKYFMMNLIEEENTESIAYRILDVCQQRGLLKEQANEQLQGIGFLLSLYENDFFYAETYDDYTAKIIPQLVDVISKQSDTAVALTEATIFKLLHELLTHHGEQFQKDQVAMQLECQTLTTMKEALIQHSKTAGFENLLVEDFKIATGYELKKFIRRLN